MSAGPLLAALHATAVCRPADCLAWDDGHSNKMLSCRRETALQGEL